MPSLADCIVEEATAWLDVPYRDKGRSRTDGVDCLGLVICVAHELGLSDYDNRDYTSRPSVRQFMAGMREHLDEIPMTECGHGDVLVMRGPRIPCHCGVVEVDRFGAQWLLHAYKPAGKVIRTSIDQYMRMRVAAFRYRGI